MMHLHLDFTPACDDVPSCLDKIVLNLTRGTQERTELDIFYLIIWSPYMNLFKSYIELNNRKQVAKYFGGYYS